MTGPLEPTNDGYALSKVAGYYMCKKYTEQYGFPTVSVMPNNLYGINDNFIPSQCHVIPSFINKFVNAKSKNLFFKHVEIKTNDYYSTGSKSACILFKYVIISFKYCLFKLFLSIFIAF